MMKTGAEETRPCPTPVPVPSGSVPDPAICGRLSVEEKRELVRQIAQRQPKDAPEILSGFRRQDLLEVICAEMGKERKYTGLTKSQMIEHLMKLVCGNERNGDSDCSPDGRFKRQRKTESPAQLISRSGDTSLTNRDVVPQLQSCQNVACRADISLGNRFCRRCACSICYRYDENKDPSLWLTCGSDTGPMGGDGFCGLSCHLKCALKDVRAGFLRNKLDGSFCCVSCRRNNSIMGAWKKQMCVAKEARRVDDMCLRIFLAKKILSGTVIYKELQKIVLSAAKLLKDEVGPVKVASSTMVRGLVNRLSCGSEVQKLCAAAVEAFDSLFSLHPNQVFRESAVCWINFEEFSPTSVVVALKYDDFLLENFIGCKIWHRHYAATQFADEPTFVSLKPQKRFKITGLQPSAKYLIKICVYGRCGVSGACEAKWVTLPLSVDSSKEGSSQHPKSDNTPTGQILLTAQPNDHSDIRVAAERHRMCYKDDAFTSFGRKSSSPATPCKSYEMQKVVKSNCRRLTGESDYEYSVRVIKGLEKEGYIEANFRVKFLTWFSLKATCHERRVVSVFVDTMADDPPSLAGQLAHTFMAEIYCDLALVSQHGFCT
ncbi:hypothetical protein MLD38_000997 [Melastoma candidum]|uniref:Uncharacterized protein n=1 Tax=Melastoma candidum TaxID=119954 RepID=A0ACB9SBR1_9MYRT|nr:hypothetical protein MLD38_000997 [Melastoma candidum]